MKNLNFKLTVDKLAKICNVSAGTVDRALNNRGGISEKTKEKILATAREYGYIDCDKSQNKLIGLVLFDLQNMYFSDLVVCFEEECSKKGYSVVTMFTSRNAKKEIECVRQLYYMGVSGIAICPVNNDEEFKNFLLSLKIPIVTVGNKIEGICHIGIDDFAATYDATQFLRKTNSKVIYYSPTKNTLKNDFADTERFRGIKTVCDENKMDLLIATNTECIEKILATDSGWAIMCSADYYLLKIIKMFPDVKVIGFDNISLLKYFDENIITVDSNSKDVAKYSVNSLVNNDLKNVTVKHKIIENTQMNKSK